MPALTLRPTHGPILPVPTKGEPMARYSGRYYRGASKDVRLDKRAQAEARNVEYRRRTDLDTE
jgi:hypothetical protein